MCSQRGYSYHSYCDKQPPFCNKNGKLYVPHEFRRMCEFTILHKGQVFNFQIENCQDFIKKPTLVHRVEHELLKLIESNISRLTFPYPSSCPNSVKNLDVLTRSANKGKLSMPHEYGFKGIVLKVSLP